VSLLLLFPGQGSQVVGMGRYLWDHYESGREVFGEAEELLGWDLRGLCLDGPADALTRTDNAQVAIFVCSVAAWRVLEQRGVTFDIALGHSLGEYSALVATGHLSFADALRVVERRGKAMWACGEQQAGTMAAVLGLDDVAVDEVCRDVGGVWPANYNAPGQVVISGEPGAVARAADVAKERGAKRVLPLQVSGAFHSPLVAGAAEDLAGVLQTVAVGPATHGRFFSTTEVRYPEVDEIRGVLVRQLTSPVRFSQSIVALGGEVAHGIEVGPGGVLAGLVKRVAPGVPVYGTADAAGLEDARRHVTPC
jgi:[acyl-carrier-protein] S-malonyltransferase